MLPIHVILFSEELVELWDLTSVIKMICSFLEKVKISLAKQLVLVSGAGNRLGTSRVLPSRLVLLPASDDTVS